jgi:Zn-dependent protease
MNSNLTLADVRTGLILYLILAASLCIHEWAHAFVADRLGDDTPRLAGRVTLNPLVHMDALGSVLFPLACIFLFPGGILFGWGKPVPINPSNFAHRRRDEVLTTLAGPCGNLCLALVAAVAGGLACRVDPRVAELAIEVIGLNAALAVFNLIPLPPLDGGTVLRHVVGLSDETYYSLSRWSFAILLVIFYLPPVRVTLGSVIGVTSWPFVEILQAVAR